MFKMVHTRGMFIPWRVQTQGNNLYHVLSSTDGILNPKCQSLLQKSNLQKFSSLLPSSFTSQKQFQCNNHSRKFCIRLLSSSVHTNNDTDANVENKSLSFDFKPLTEEEEKKEKERVAGLTKFQKEMELRKLDAALSHFNTLRGINTGELYTLRGKFKALARDYGIGFMIWYWTIWTTSAALTYTTITVGGVDVMVLLTKVDGYTGLDISTKVDPELGTIALSLAVNELLEPLRLPVVVLTTKPVVDFFTRK